MNFLYQILLVIGSATHILIVEHLVWIHALSHHQVRLLCLVETPGHVGVGSPLPWRESLLTSGLIADGSALSHLVVQMHELLTVLPSVVGCYYVLYFLRLGHVLTAGIATDVLVQHVFTGQLVLRQLIVFVEQGLRRLLPDNDFLLVSLLLAVVPHQLVVLGRALFGRNQIRRVVYIAVITVVDLAYLLVCIYVLGSLRVVQHVAAALVILLRRPISQMLLVSLHSS